jgi:epoxyqueuosine reductase
MVSNPKAWVLALVDGFCQGPENSLRNGSGERAWDSPLVGFSRGDDPLFLAYKQHVGPFHWTPDEVFALAFPEPVIDPGQLTVICWILPQTEGTKAENRGQSYYPAERWARSRIFGEAFNAGLRQHLVERLGDAGYPAVAPLLAAEWKWQDSERYGYASTWSERHAAFASGLGTFGLCDGLITPVGKAVRVGSVVAQIPIPPTPRAYTHHRAYCSYFVDGSCGECIDRCPVGAITEKGHDKVKCRAHVSGTSAYVEEAYGFQGYGCGLCQTGVPCESGLPL